MVMVVGENLKVEGEKEKKERKREREKEGGIEIESDYAHGLLSRSLIIST